MQVEVVDSVNACGLSANGVVTCWGNSTIQTSELFSTLKNGSALCGITLDGNVACFNNIDVSFEGNFVDVIASSVNPCGLTASGVVHCLRPGVP